METSEYIKLLRHPYWQRKRLEVLNRDRFACQKCGETFKNLQVHHKFYDFSLFPWEYQDDALVTLCELCHEKEEFIKWILREGVRLMEIDRLRVDDIRSIINLIQRRLIPNHHEESARLYMNNLKDLLHA